MLVSMNVLINYKEKIFSAKAKSKQVAEQIWLENRRFFRVLHFSGTRKNNFIDFRLERAGVTLQ